MATNGFNYGTSRWHKTRNAIHKRDNFKCQICGTSVIEKGSYNIDHIEPITADSPDKLKYGYSNLRCLCIPCHNAVRPEQQLIIAKRNQKKLNDIFNLIK